MAANMKITQTTVEKAIAKRHREDMFFTEVKDGPSGGSFSRIDALAIALSWASPCVTGYEIKVDRSDFINDKKWMNYLPMCNMLYFASPPGIILKEEVPQDCGLVHLMPSGQLRTIKKAPYRQIDPPWKMYMYLMMQYIGSRENYESRAPKGTGLLAEMNVERWKSYLEGKLDSKRIGRDVSSKMLNEIKSLRRKADCADQIGHEKLQLESQLNNISLELGLDPSKTWGTSYQVNSILNEIKKLKKNGGSLDITKLLLAKQYIEESIQQYEKSKTEMGIRE